MSNFYEISTLISGTIVLGITYNRVSIICKTVFETDDHRTNSTSEWHKWVAQITIACNQKIKLCL